MINNGRNLDTDYVKYYGEKESVKTGRLAPNLAFYIINFIQCNAILQFLLRKSFF